MLRKLCLFSIEQTFLMCLFILGVSAIQSRWGYTYNKVENVFIIFLANSTSGYNHRPKWPFWSWVIPCLCTGQGPCWSWVIFIFGGVRLTDLLPAIPCLCHRQCQMIIAGLFRGSLFIEWGSTEDFGKCSDCFMIIELLVMSEHAS